MIELSACPKCSCEYTYSNGNFIVCPECFYEWNPSELPDMVEETNKILDANGNELRNGDTIIIVKDLHVKGAAKALKSGTKVKNIRLVDGDHNIDCKIDGFGAMALKSEFVKKV